MAPIKTETSVDYVGAGLLSGGLIALLLALSEGPEWGWLSGKVGALYVLAVVLFVLWVFAVATQTTLSSIHLAATPYVVLQVLLLCRFYWMKV